MFFWGHGVELNLQESTSLSDFNQSMRWQ